MSKSIAIIGLGLIGGSMAMALQGFEDHEVVGVDVSQPTLRFAAENHVADRVTSDAEQALRQADIVFLCLHPQGIVDFLAEHRDHFRPGALVTDVCGVKTAIVEAAQVLPPEVEFIGGHPMAGTEFSGVQNALRHMFRDAHYIIVPDENSSPEKVALLERMAAYIGCSDVVRTTPRQHDAIIAYTSQMMHIIAVSVCDDPQLFEFMGFEGDSFRGCTRVAALDVPLWTQLFSLNADALDQALERLEQNIGAYRSALRCADRSVLAQKLEYSSARKRAMNREEEKRKRPG
ncbi:MAG: prephenate dehydrogenase/arogenate dehydrogenase family protein [Oscillospiraceae bacterium]|nr:prephenate dehydrogenase/arogenate dehydrogenase family protein [Oscillospiraceae bacterium]